MDWHEITPFCDELLRTRRASHERALAQAQHALEGLLTDCTLEPFNDSPVVPRFEFPSMPLKKLVRILRES